MFYFELCYRTALLKIAELAWGGGPESDGNSVKWLTARVQGLAVLSLETPLLFLALLAQSQISQRMHETDHVLWQTIVSL